MTTQDVETLLANFRNLPKHQLKRLSKAVKQELKARYPDHHKRKYGPTLNRTFSEEEHQRFMAHVEQPKAWLAFKLMYLLGLRIGEAVEIKLEHIDWINRTILINTEKSHTCDILPLHDTIFPLLQEWVNQHHAAILNHQGHILYSDNPVQHRQHISKYWLRNYFAKAREKAGLNQIYALTNERTGRKSRRQYRITTHSNRRSFGTALWHLTKDTKLVQLALRQTSPQSVEPYIFVGREEVHAVIRQGYQQLTAIPRETIKTQVNTP